IAANLGSTSTDRHLHLTRVERGLMFVTFVIMAAIEVSLFVDKPHARVFAVTILALGLVLRGLARERAAKKEAPMAEPAPAPIPKAPAQAQPPATFRDPLLCAVRGIGKTLDFAVEEAKETARPLYVLFVREQAVITPEDRQRKWQQDPEAKQVFEYAQAKAGGLAVVPCYAVSDSAADTIVDV